MNKETTKNWLFASSTSILLIVFGLVSIFIPTITIVVLSLYFAITVLVGGIALGYLANRVRIANGRWGYLLLESVIGIVLGLIILIKPQKAAAAFVVIIGLWAILIGALFLLNYFKSVIPRNDKIVTLVFGILSSITGLLLIVKPFESSRTLAVIIGVYTLLYGVLSLVSKRKFKVL